MRIAFLNPWKNAAENQAFRSLELAAARIGHELVNCTNSDEIQQAEPEFVLAAASTQPKLTKFSTYGVVHEPRDRFLSRRDYFHNLLSYDGHLAISETLRQFLNNLLFGIGRPTPKIGYYYNSCQENVIDPDFLARLKQGKVKLTYFGTNWDNRRVRFFQLLSDLDDVEIYGPPKSWTAINGNAYKGLLPFDGCSVQKKYRENGIGVVLLSEKHLADDVISNRIFEITSVGAIAICCRTKWIEQVFGDSVYYFDQRLPADAIVDQITSTIELIKRNPLTAYERAQRAYRIFVERFSAEKLLQNAIDYHVALTRESKQFVAISSPRSATSPLISVIVRCGGRPVETVRSAIRCITAQTFGHFQIILVRYTPLDVGPLVSEFQSSVDSIICLDCLGGGRSETLWCGLNQVKGEYFSILDDDDELMPEHFQWLFYSSDYCANDTQFMYTGSIRVSLSPKETEEGNLERRSIYSFGIGQCRSFFDQSSFFSSNCFVAHSSLLSNRLLADPGLKTAEDSYLILSLLAHSTPRFNFRATAVHHESALNSDFTRDPNRPNDVLNLHLRLLAMAGQAPECVDAHDLLRQQSDAIIYRRVCDVEERDGLLVYHCRDFPLSQVKPESLVAVPFCLERKNLNLADNSYLIDLRRGSMWLRPPRVPWAQAAVFRLTSSAPPGEPYLLEINCEVRKGTVGFGVLNQREDDFIYRIAVPASSPRLSVHLPIDTFSTVGRFVVQNWNAGAEGEIKILNMNLFSARSSD
jgi:hypothetical protein